jgi:hypothetical protein
VSVRPSVRVSSFSRAVISFCSLSILRRSKPPSKEKVIRQVELEWGRFIRRLSDVACRWGYSTNSPPPPPPAHNQADRKISSFSCCLISDPIPLFLCAVEFLAVLCTLQCYEYPYRLCQQCNAPLKLFNFTKCIN